MRNGALSVQKKTVLSRPLRSQVRARTSPKCCTWLDLEVHGEGVIFSTVSKPVTSMQRAGRALFRFLGDAAIVILSAAPRRRAPYGNR